jgi:hypothetical protein
MGVIIDSVGRNGKNQPQDVLSVKALLNAYSPRPTTLPHPKLALLPSCDQQTLVAIDQFQKEILGFPKPDGLIEPTRPTIQRLVLGATLGGKVTHPLKGSKQDTMVVQALLNRFLPPTQRVQVDGLFGSKSLSALQSIQQSQMNMSAPLQSVEPGSVTLRYLTEGPYYSPGTGDPITRSKAWDLVTDFAKKTQGGVFKGIPRQSVAKSLYERVESPSKLHQGSSSLCGPMTLLYHVARSNPETYVKYVIGLYETGTGTIKDLYVKAGADLKNTTAPGNVDLADWIAAASLRDSENLFFDYDMPSKEAAGITLPSSIENWLKRVGATNIHDGTNLVFKNSWENLFQAGVASSKPKTWVFLLIDSGVLYKPLRETSRKSYHWVGLLSANIQKTVVRLEVFTWGTKQTIPVTSAGFMKTGEFLDYYYGHIRCTAP